MSRIFAYLLIAGLSACATVPESVKIALAKEGSAISAVESDYIISVERYHAELINQIDGRLNDIFQYEIERMELTGKAITSSDVIRLEKARSRQRTLLTGQANEARDKYLSSINLEILKSLHGKVLEYAEADKFTASDFATVITEIDAEVDKIKEDKAGAETSTNDLPDKANGASGDEHK